MKRDRGQQLDGGLYVPIGVLLISVVVMGFVGAEVLHNYEQSIQPPKLCDDVFGEEWEPVDPEAEPGEARCRAPNGTVENPWDHVEFASAG